MFDTRVAVSLRTNIKQLIEKTYLVASDRNIRDYKSVVDRIVKDLEKYPIAKRFKSLTQADADTAARLQKLYFNQFKEAGNTIQEAISQEIYNASLINRPFKDVVKNIKQQINGVYMKSDKEEINKLVKIANADPTSRAGKRQ